MMYALIDKKGSIAICKLRPDRGALQCKFDIIILPEKLFSPEFVMKLKRKHGLLNMDEYDVDPTII